LYRKRRFEWLKVLSLILASATLVVLILGFNGVIPTIFSMPTESTEQPAITETRLIVSPSGLTRLGESPPPGTPIPSTATIEVPPVDAAFIDEQAQEWASLLMDRAQERIDQSPSMSWWPQSSASTLLDVNNYVVTLAGIPVGNMTQQDVSFLAYDADSNSGSAALGKAQISNAALVLSVYQPDTETVERDWRLGGQKISPALEALAFEAQSRGLLLRVGTYQPDPSMMQIALLDVRPLSIEIAEETTQAPTSDSPAAATPTGVSVQPSPTREPDVFVERAVNEKMDTILAELGDYNPAIVAAFAESHPQTGLLTWTETGAAVDGEHVRVRQATSLTFYNLSEDGSTNRVFEVVYENTVTRLPDDEVFFPEHRMEEMLFWMIKKASAEGGQLIVAYDNLGEQQAITFIGFQAFRSS